MDIYTVRGFMGLARRMHLVVKLIDIDIAFLVHLYIKIDSTQGYDSHETCTSLTPMSPVHVLVRVPQLLASSWPGAAGGYRFANAHPSNMLHAKGVHSAARGDHRVKSEQNGPELRRRCGRRGCRERSDRPACSDETGRMGPHFVQTSMAECAYPASSVTRTRPDRRFAQRGRFDEPADISTENNPRNRWSA